MSGLSASPPVKTTPPESAEPQDSAEASSCSQDSLTDMDAPAPQPDPDAWIQVEKRHRQPPGKTKVLKFRPAYIFIFHPLHVLTSSTLCAVVSCCPYLCLCLPPVGQQHVSDEVSVFSSSPPSALQPNRFPSSVEYFLLSAHSSPCFLKLYTFIPYVCFLFFILTHLPNHPFLENHVSVT